jgi:hypothetical protein
MSLKIVKSSDVITVENINLCIYGAPGLGKTSLAFTADAPLLLDFDRGSHRAANRKDAVPISSWADVTSITGTDLEPYHTVIVDTAGRALDFLTADIIAANPKMGRGGALTLQGYGELKSKFAAWLKMLRMFGKDVVLTAHMDEQRSGDDVIERLDVQGGSKGEIYKSVDAMGRLFVRGKERVLDFSPRENSFGKNPCGLEIVAFPDPVNNPQYLAKLMVEIKGRLNQATKDQVAAQADLAGWKEALEDFTTAEDFNRCLPEFKKASQAIKLLVVRRAKTVGVIFNQTSGLYEEPVNAAVS